MPRYHNAWINRKWNKTRHKIKFESTNKSICRFLFELCVRSNVIICVLNFLIILFFIIILSFCARVLFPSNSFFSLFSFVLLFLLYSVRLSFDLLFLFLSFSVFRSCFVTNIFSIIFTCIRQPKNENQIERA